MSDPRCYTLPQLLGRLQLTRTTFYRLHAAGRLPFVSELRPRLGRTVRYRADLVDRYLAGQWGTPQVWRRPA